MDLYECDNPCVHERPADTINATEIWLPSHDCGHWSPQHQSSGLMFILRLSWRSDVLSCHQAAAVRTSHYYHCHVQNWDQSNHSFAESMSSCTWSEKAWWFWLHHSWFLYRLEWCLDEHELIESQFEFPQCHSYHALMWGLESYCSSAADLSCWVKRWRGMLDPSSERWQAHQLPQCSLTLLSSHFCWLSDAETIHMHHCMSASCFAGFFWQHLQGLLPHFRLAMWQLFEEVPAWLHVFLTWALARAVFIELYDHILSVLSHSDDFFTLWSDLTIMFTSSWFYQQQQCWLEDFQAQMSTLQCYF